MRYRERIVSIIEDDGLISYFTLGTQLFDEEIIENFRDFYLENRELYLK